MNDENLIPLSERSKEDAKAIQIAGGLARGKALKEEKRMRQWAKILGELPTKIASEDGEEMDADNFGSVIHAQFEKAKKGDTQAAKFLADLMGEMEQTQNLNIGGQEGGEPLRIVDTRKVHRSPLIIDETPEGEATETE